MDVSFDVFQKFEENANILSRQEKVPFLEKNIWTRGSTTRARSRGVADAEVMGTLSRVKGRRSSCNKHVGIYSETFNVLVEYVSVICVVPVLVVESVSLASVVSHFMLLCPTWTVFS